MATKILKVNGHDCTIQEFIAANDLSEVEIETLENLAVNEFCLFGGGAFQEFTVTRVA